MDEADPRRVVGLGGEGRSANLDLVAGDVREILLTLAVGDRAALADPDRFVAYLPLGDLDPSWLDALTHALGDRGGRGPGSFRAALHPLADRLAAALEQDVGLVDPSWLEAFADLDEAALEPIARRWLAAIARSDETTVEAGRIEVELAVELLGAVVHFARRALEAAAVVWAASPPIVAARDVDVPDPAQPRRTAVPEAVTMSIEPPTVS